MGLLDGLLFRSTQPETTTLEEDPTGQALFTALIEAQSLSSTALPPVICAALAAQEQGRGLYATQAIKSGQPVVSIPWDTVITPTKAAQMSSLCQALAPAADMKNLPDWTLLAMWLVELLSMRYIHSSNNNSSEMANALYSRYAEVLPKGGTSDTKESGGIGNVLEWTDAEVSWLQGSYLHTLALEIRNAASTSWQELEPLVQNAEKQGSIPKNLVTEASLRHAFAVLLSRLIRVQVQGDFENSMNTKNTLGQSSELEVLCPWADFVNHSCDSTQFLHFNRATRCIELLAPPRGYLAGEQIFANYGQKTSGELLLSYGFAPKEGTNPYDACLLCLPGSIEKNINKRVYPLRMGQTPNELLETAGGPQGVLDLCKKASVGYKISLEAAKSELQVLESTGKRDGRRAAVLRILIFEQKVLARAVFLLKQEVKKKLIK